MSEAKRMHPEARVITYLISLLSTMTASQGVQKKGGDEAFARITDMLGRICDLQSDDWFESLSLLKTQFRYFPYFLDCDRKGFAKVSSASRCKLVALEKLYLQYQDAIIEENKAVASSLGKIGIQPIFFKGRELNRATTKLLRLSGDTDYLVRQGDLEKARTLFEKQGYLQGYTKTSDFNTVFNPAKANFLDIWPIPEHANEAVKAHHHQVHPYMRIFENGDFQYANGDDMYAEQKHVYFHKRKSYSFNIIDLHFNIAVGVEESDYLRTLRPFDDGTGASAMIPPEVMVCFFAGRAYYEPLVLNQKSFRDLIDLFTVLLFFGDELDWDWVLYFAAKYRSIAALYYVFRHIESILGNRLIPTDIFTFLEKRMLEHREYDLGDFLAKCFGIVPHSECHNRLIAPMLRSC